jgi:hypothetical protein
MPLPLMPKATAVWLVDNTTLTFEQIARFCGLHPLEVKGIADGEVAIGIQGRDPITTGELTAEEIARCTADSGTQLRMAESDVPRPKARTSGPKYTPVTKRQDRPNAIMWLLRYHAELSDAQVCRLVGTTKPTIATVRDRTHWNMSNLKPIDPVTLGMCSQTELDEAVTKAQARKRARERREEREAARAAVEAGMAPAPGDHTVPEPEHAREEAKTSVVPILERPKEQPTASEQHSLESVFGKTAVRND